MSSWVLQLALLTACLRFGCAEGDPLPPALVELVRSSPIASIQDLQLLLLTDSVEGDPDSHTARGHHSNATFSRLPRSLDAQPAQQALCKVRTEVQEVTRAMLDRRNANFMLWPPCVEVQRCSGCCNARTLQCVPVITHTRYLQVMKIQYINKHPHYDKAVVSVLDHVECRCQSAPIPKAPRTTPKKLQPRRPTPKDTLAKGRSKEELHRQDELKRNQKFQLEEGQQWQPKYSQTQMLDTQADMGLRGDNAFPDHFHTNLPESETGETLVQVPPRARNRTRQREEEELALLRGLGLQRHYQDMEESGLHENSLNSTELPPVEEKWPAWQNYTENATRERRPGLRHDLTGQRATKDRQPIDRSFSEEAWSLEGQTHKAQTDNPLPHQEVMAAPTTMRPPPVPPTARTPARRAPPRRRMRKNRNRISKAAMRAMLM
ncbi:hypothetical protein JZ751_021464 [Albula glossodonta]|uniref:Platelet-derived growth factor subunit B n=1 Tax=Albula glossodonta TaxID=121402 RepID=A0A8T2NMR9_9TELE|nr:hypothetical protein JZ751_021464 [Albula glossodonta]